MPYFAWISHSIIQNSVCFLLGLLKCNMLKTAVYLSPDRRSSYTSTSSQYHAVACLVLPLGFFPAWRLIIYLFKLCILFPTFYFGCGLL
ncbi:hypothetical protein FKM82_015229 [Ascaphus truei]